ncbi:FecR family protein [Pedobacter montanisoli]|uniref:FecR family protein n=1 Tax=Pedobacter montanisoli TaxID=2923277 RepID=A0ABS9ZWG9_9SPHI|nr:FecR family protein [Pedobacter montanisoli]MCJ0742642.1 FecR family protein [Pedobacter montanisoli]
MSTFFDSEEELRKIINKYIKGKATKDEIRFIESYYSFLDAQEDAEKALGAEEFAQLEHKGLSAIQDRIKLAHKPNRNLNWKKYTAAVVLLMGITAAGFYYLNTQKQSQVNSLVVHKGKLDVLPGEDAALLTLSTGETIALNENNREKLLKDSRLSISANAEGQLVYQVNAANSGSQNPHSFNTIETRKGNQFQLILADGTKVWLNALSSLRFPEVFNGKTREVELQGEGYFEVEKDKAHPFIVKTSSLISGNKQEVEVLGTHFNINSYDSAIRTTLAEGSVRVSNGNVSKILAPSYQSILTHNQIQVYPVNVEDEIDWKNGLFRFNNASLQSILLQLERWYNIDADMKNVPNKRYNGVISRKANLSEVLNMLSLTGNIEFELTQDRKLYINQTR